MRYRTRHGGDAPLVHRFQANPTQSHEIMHRLADLAVAIELAAAGGTVGIVHADCPTKVWPDFIDALESAHDEAFLEGLVESALWSRECCFGMCENMVEDVRAVVVGHTPMTRWMTLGNVIHIDTGAWMDDEARDFCLLDAATLRPVEDRPGPRQAPAGPFTMTSRHE